MIEVAPHPNAPGFADALAEHGDRPALLFAGQAISYLELRERVQAAQADLARLTGTRRELVRLRPAPTVEFVTTWLATLSSGQVTLLTADDALAVRYRAGVEYAAGWRFTGRPSPDLHPDLRLLLSTSGSTGSPKLVRLSGTAVAANAAAIATYLRLSSDDVAVTTLPLDYCYGLSVLHSHLQVGAAVLLEDRSVTDPGLWASARAHRVTSFAGVPHTFDLLDSLGWPDLPSLRRVTQAGGRMAPDQVRRIAERGATQGWDLVVMYGQTEATARMGYLPPHLASSHPDTVGIAIPGGRFRLAPVAGAEPGVGELVYSGPNVMMGYAEHPDQLARPAEIDELRTGDLARISDGLVRIVGRQARFAKLFGQRIDLDRTETLLSAPGRHVGCAESADGRSLVVAVETCPDAATAESILDQLADTAAVVTGLPRHAVRTVALPQLPRLGNGKLDYRAMSARTPQPMPTREADRAESLLALYARILNRPDAKPGDSFQSLRGDSLSFVELSLHLERRLDRLPADWPARPIESLTGSDRVRRTVAPDAVRSSVLARVDTAIVVRAVAIVMIVGSHTNLWLLLGGAHLLLIVAGMNFARFLLVDEPPRARLSRVARACARVVCPAVLWIGAVALLTGDYPWRTVLLLNDLLGDPHWSEPEWHYWFLEVVLLLTLGCGALLAVPRLARWEARHRFEVAAATTIMMLLPRWWVSNSHYEGDVIHTTVFIGWLFAGGWAAAVATGFGQRAVVSGLLLGGALGFTEEPQRDLVIALGALLLVWVRNVWWPRVLLRVTGVLASASLYIYLTHWQVYPSLEDRWPLAGLIASLAFGVLTWQVANRVPAASLPRLPARFLPRAWSTLSVPQPNPSVRNAP